VDIEFYVPHGNLQVNSRRRRTETFQEITCSGSRLVFLLLGACHCQLAQWQGKSTAKNQNKL